MQFVLAHSSHAHLPERADVLVSDQIGQFGFEAGLVAKPLPTSGRDCSSRAAVSSPGRVTMYLAPVETPELRDGPGLLGQRPGGLRASGPLRDDRASTAATGFASKPDQLLGAGVRGRRDRSADGRRRAVRPATRSLTASRDGVLDGIGGWFVADLAGRDHDDQCSRRSESHRSPQRGVSRSIRRCRCTPATPSRCPCASRPSIFWCSGRSSCRTAGDFRIRRWTECSSRARIWSARIPAFMPRLTGRGVARRTVLELCDGRPLHEPSSARCYERHRDLFDSETAAHVFVAEVVTRYCV